MFIKWPFEALLFLLVINDWLLDRGRWEIGEVSLSSSYKRDASQEESSFIEWFVILLWFICAFRGGFRLLLHLTINNKVAPVIKHLLSFLLFQSNLPISLFVWILVSSRVDQISQFIHSHSSQTLSSLDMSLPFGVYFIFLGSLSLGSQYLGFIKFLLLSSYCPVWFFFTLVLRGSDEVSQFINCNRRTIDISFP